MTPLRRSTRSLISFFLSAALLSSCNSKLDKTGGIDDKTTPILTAAEISFPLVNKYVFSKNCTSCHAPPQIKGNVNLDSYESASAFGAQIKADIDSGRMPQAPTPPLSQRQKDIVNLWVAQGMPNEAGSPPAPPRAPLEPKWASIKEGIFKFKCDTCHNPEGKAKRVKLAEASDLLVGQRFLVVPGKPEESKLMKVLLPGARRPMPPPTSDDKPLTPEQVELVRAWIQDGAVDDSQDENSKFKAIQKGIQVSCTGCHTMEGSADEVPLDSYKDIMGGGTPYIIPKAQPMMSRLLRITSVDAKRNPMPPKDSGIAPLTQEEWNIIKDWMTNGADQ